MHEITLITGNPKKAEQLQKYLSAPVTHQALDLPEIQSLDVIEIAKDKAERAFTILKQPIIVEDTSLSFHALNGLPGPLIKWFLDRIGSEGLCQLLNSYTNRSATAATCIVYQDETTQKIFTGETTGAITESPQGPTDFGWNNIFIPDGATISWAQMSADNMEKDSMRFKAVRQLNDFILKSI